MASTIGYFLAKSKSGGHIICSNDEEILTIAVKFFNVDVTIFEISFQLALNPLNREDEQDKNSYLNNWTH